MAAVGRRVGAELSGLVLNERGWERLAQTPLDRVNVTFAATETFNQRNGNATLAEAAARDGGGSWRRRRPALDRDDRVLVRLPVRGAVDPGVVADARRAARTAGAGEVVLADTIGVATPRPVRALVERVAIRGVPVGGHCHDTRQHRLVCASRARRGRRERARRVGRRSRRLPVLPARDRQRRDRGLLYLLDREGVETGVDLDALVAVSQWLEELLGRELAGCVYRGSDPTTPASTSSSISAFAVAGLDEDLAAVLRRAAAARSRSERARRRPRTAATDEIARPPELLQDPGRRSCSSSATARRGRSPARPAPLRRGAGRAARRSSRRIRS